MRLLILGGTQFLGRAIAAHACTMGHDVTCAARGVTGKVPDRGLGEDDREAAPGPVEAAGRVDGRIPRSLLYRHRIFGFRGTPSSFHVPPKLRPQARSLGS